MNEERPFWESCYLEQQSYVLEDEHPGNIHHRHPVNKLVAKRPDGEDF